ncbi:SDR family oxidoreductase [Candidatus Marimicrobium litorale]|uniref:NmrA-like domain-containing protein n=1 Tax=Candidatus Marimicrobium litorale TaxID=2518991 RepID=A0ABT3T8M0_9GAMM|nr:NmrA family NAD(P)-binding protein [Candidatus Marimicrobium litorale]MCX2978626.1 hypothetical protein [Candidatus Marimicrobium litorale]
MPEDIITVFGASGRQGLAQVRQLVACGYRVRAVTRSPDTYSSANLTGVTAVFADYNDTSSLVRACAGSRGVFFTHPMFEDALHVNSHIARVATAAKEADVERLVYNTSSWVPDTPCGEPNYDGNLVREDIFAVSGTPFTIIRPVLFMDNLLTNWVKPGLIHEGLYRYPHKATMCANWICLDDVAKFMIAALNRDDLAGERIVVGGPQALSPLDIAEALSQAIGKPIRYQYITPRKYGELMYDLFKHVSSLSREDYASALDAFYIYNNEQDGLPFQVDMAPVLRRIPVKLTPFSDWAKQQDWTLRKAGPSGG